MKFLLATDGSKYSDGAARFLGRFDLSKDDEIMVLHVIPGVPFPHGGHPYVNALMQLGEEMAPMIIDETVGLLKDIPARISTVTTTGHPSDFISAIGSQSGADLIVVGSRGMKAIGSFLLGSVTRAVAIKAEQSVLVVKPPQGKQNGPLKVLFATDGSSCAEETGRMLLRMPFRPDTAVIAVYVSLSAFMDIPDRFTAAIDERMKKIVAEMKKSETEHAEMVLDEAQKRLKEKFGTVRAMIRNGDPSEQILHASGETQVDIIALGSRGIRGVSGMLGSVARNVLGHADCSVLVCKLCT